PLTWLKGMLVKVQHNGQPRREEQQADHAGIALVAREMPYGAQESQYQRQEVIFVIRGIGFQRVGQGVLPAQSHLVNKFDAAYPVAASQVAMALFVVLPARKVPQEVAAVHMPHLVAKKEPQVVAKGWALAFAQV